MKTLQMAGLYMAAAFALATTVAFAADAPGTASAQGAAATSGTAAAAAAAPAAQSGYPAERDKVCTRCHDENDDKPILTIYQTRHGVIADSRTPSCQGCHGTSDDHIRNSKGTTPRPAPEVVFGTKHASPAEDQSKACITCHQSGLRAHWLGSEHQTRDVTCSNCHQSHAPHDRVLAKVTQPDVCYACHQTQRAQTYRISTHPIVAGTVTCSDCHNPHGSTGPKLLVKNTVNETCFTCHAEKRGPFLWEHPSANDDCMNCHTPHGSTNPPLLRARAPWLCQECHGDGAPHPGNVYSGSSLPGGAVANVNNTGGVGGTPPAQLGAVNPLTGARVTQNNPPAQLAFRACVNCHQAVHGSNHPAGNRFLR